MKRLKWLLSTVLVVVLITVSFVGCKQEEVTKVRLNEVVHSIFYAPQYVALEKDFFKEEGLEIELSTGHPALILEHIFHVF